MFVSDYPGAIVFPADDTNILRGTNHPKVIVLHTPEEPADDYESTPVYFSQPFRYASTHYYSDNDGDIYAMVPEARGAIANGVTAGMPYPSGTDSGVSLNLQSLSIEIEGYADGMHRTMPRGGRQWNSVARWIANRAAKYHIPVDREHVIGHYQVASNRHDPGTLNIDMLVADAQAMIDRGKNMTEVEKIKILRRFRGTFSEAASHCDREEPLPKGLIDKLQGILNLARS